MKPPFFGEGSRGGEKAACSCNRKSAIPGEPGQPETAQEKLIIWLLAIAVLVLGSIVDKPIPDVVSEDSR